MKFIFTLISFAIIVTSANATVHIVTCQNSPSHFLPLTVNAVVGDTIHWTWVEGNHIVGPVNSTDIPNGAATWNGYIDFANHDFEYQVTVAGTYNYDCHPATPHGEEASIVVSDVTGVPQYNVQADFFSVYPNPTQGKFQLAFDGLQLTENCKVEIYNVPGQRIYQSLITAANLGSFRKSIDLSNETSGIYFVKFYNGQAILTEKIVIQ